MSVINPQTQAGRTFAQRDGVAPAATFYWNPLVGNWLVWDSTVGINTDTSNVALENGGNLSRIVSLLQAQSAAAVSTSVADQTTLLQQILMQLQFIATALSAPIVNFDTPVSGG